MSWFSHAAQPWRCWPPACWPGHAQAADPVTVAVTAIVEHPALDAARDGIKAELQAAGYEDGKNLAFVYESAQGNPATAAQIARKLVGDAPDVIVPISTPSAQAVVGATKDIPVVFTAVTDPVGAKLVHGPRRIPAATSPACRTCRRSASIST